VRSVGDLSNAIITNGCRSSSSCSRTSTRRPAPREPAPKAAAPLQPAIDAIIKKGRPVRRQNRVRRRQESKRRASGVIVGKDGLVVTCEPYPVQSRLRVVEVHRDGKKLATGKILAKHAKYDFGNLSKSSKKGRGQASKLDRRAVLTQKGPGLGPWLPAYGPIRLMHRFPINRATVPARLSARSMGRKRARTGYQRNVFQ